MNILIVDDSAVIRSILKDIIGLRTDMKVTGEATNGKQAIEMNSALKPDLIIMDINMSVMDGLEATKRIMETNPVPIIVFSSALDAKNSFTALQNGAVDVMNKPEIDRFNIESFAGDFYEKLIQAAKAKLSGSFQERKKSSLQPVSTSRYNGIVIGASTGGPKTIRSILSRLPDKLPVGIALVQHLEPGFENGYAQWLQKESGMTVVVAHNNSDFAPGIVYVSPIGKHLVFRNNRLFLDDTPSVLNQKPSVDVCFHSAAENFREKVIGILLTGMGRDGAQGCVSIVSNGGCTIVQDRESSTIFSMPKAAIELNGASIVLSLEAIPGYIMTLLGG